MPDPPEFDNAWLMDRYYGRLRSHRIEDDFAEIDLEEPEPEPEPEEPTTESPEKPADPEEDEADYDSALHRKFVYM